MIALMDKEFIPAYEGNDMARYIMKIGFELPDFNDGGVRSVTNTKHGQAIIVTDYAIYRARPEHGVGFCIECLFKG